MSVIQVTEENFDEVVMKSEKPVLIDFYADWCGPCKMMAPVVEQLADEYADDYAFCKCDVDDQPGLALRYQITSIPALVAMNLGMFAGISVGAVGKDEVLALLRRASEKKDAHVTS